MRKQTLLLSCAIVFAISTHAEKIDVTQFRHNGPYLVQMPYMMDSVNVQQKKFDVANLLDYASVLPENNETGDIVKATDLPATTSGYAIHQLSFSVTNTSFTKAELTVGGLGHSKTFVDGMEQVGKELSLQPSTHQIVIRYLAQAGKKDTARVSLTTEKAGALAVTADGTSRNYTILDVLHAEKFSRGTSLSATGKYAIVNTQKTEVGGKSVGECTVREVATGRIVATGHHLQWMPTGNRYFKTEPFNGRQTMTAIDAATGAQTVVASNLPKDVRIMVSPDESYLILTKPEEGPKEDKDVYEIIHPDDRQPGWRDRSSIYRYDIATGIMQQMIYGHHSVYVADISRDSKYLLLHVSESRLTKRPTTLFSLIRMNVKTLMCDTIVSRDGFIGTGIFSPDGNQVLVSGSPECLDGIGKNVGEGQTPSMIDMQLYMIDIAGHKVTPLTRTFNPNVQDMQWSWADGMVYFTAEDKDCINLFRLNPKNGNIKRLACKEEIVSGISAANAAQTLLYYGESASNSSRLYCLNTKTEKNTLIEDLSAENLKGVKLGKCEAWSFTNSRGDTILCRYYLPPTFDAAKKYPMIVNYYGGCSPTSRNFEGRYPQHAYAALGYVVLVVEPSGATGFGQDFSARHVNTAGEGPAEDIIKATKTFCKEHEYVNAKKIGCIGASYGGFMTQYLQTKTDIFAAAISHAGISDHTSYWGEGYWGYSYSEVSMANSYPWSHPDLYTKQSPLFNADKIHTPLLFVHGDADTNVPIGESIQMYNALKLLGRETAFVAVKGQDHHILEYSKRLKWQNTIWAWFAKYLQDDDTWWNSIYPKKEL